MSQAPPVVFTNKKKTDFFPVLRRRVDEYFKSNNIKKFGGSRMWGKAIAMLLIYFIPFGLILTGWFNGWTMWGLTAIMGVGIAGIGLGFMHDANHGSYHKKQKINDFMGLSLNLIGGHAFTWKMQHNVLHHTYTNIYKLDEDTNPGPVMRFNPQAKASKLYRFQHIYAPFFYSLLTLVWVLHKDYLQVIRYNKMGLLKQNNTTLRKQLTAIVISKLFYYTYILVLPMLILDIAFWQWLVGFLTIHMLGGLILGLVFQAAHVVEHLDFPEPSNEGEIESEWAIHQMRTTADFARHNKLLSWFMGGLNFQIEHHLFPKISHVHYPAMAEIVKSTAEEYGIPYIESRTWIGALASHFRVMRNLGQKGEFVPVMEMG